MRIGRCSRVQREAMRWIFQIGVKDDERVVHMLKFMLA